MPAHRNSVPTIDKLKTMAKRHAKNTGVSLSDAKHQLAVMYDCTNWQTLKGVSTRAAAIRTFGQTCKDALLSSMANLSIDQTPDSLRNLETELNGTARDYYVDMFLTVAYRAKIEGASSIREACEKAMELQGDLSAMNESGGDLPYGIVSAIQQEEYPQEFAIEACEWEDPDRAYIPLAYVLEKDILSRTFAAMEPEVESEDVDPLALGGETRHLIVFYDEYETGELYLDPEKLAEYGCPDGGKPIPNDLWGKIKAQGLVRSLHVNYPRASRHGIPNCATDDGGREYAKDFVMGVADDFFVKAEDMGTDNVEAHWLEIEVPVELADEVESNAETKENDPGWKMPLSEIEINDYDGVEVAPCVSDGEGGMERCDDIEGAIPDIWSVYLHCVEGGVECIADFTTEKEANAYGEVMENLLEQHGVLKHRLFTSEKPKEVKVFTLVVAHRHGENVYTEPTYEKAYQQLYEYVCEEWWEAVEKFDVEPDKAPDDKDLAIKTYFDAWANSSAPESWEIIEGGMEIEE